MRKTRNPKAVPPKGVVDPNAIPPAAALALAADKLIQAGERDRGVEMLHQAVRIDPHLAGAWQGLGVDAFYHDQHAEAFTYFQRGIRGADRMLRTDPHNRPSLVSRGACYYALCQCEEAAESTRRALEIAPDANLHRLLLCIMNFLTGTTPESRYEEARKWASLHADPLAKDIRPHTNSPDPDRPIRLAYLSPDLFNHAVMKFIQPVFENHDPSQVELFVYSVGTKTDESTDHARATVKNFVSFSGPAHELADRIRADGIDILVDIAGHTMQWPYFQTFALKPAPIQVTWLGLMATTGLKTMDYFIGDPWVPCPGTEHCFTEKIYRLPRVGSCYRPRDGHVPVAPAPCLKRGYITFGSFNQPTKITKEVVHLWAKIMRAVPKSRLMLKYAGLEAAEIQDRLSAWFAKERISRGRLQFAGASMPAEYLETFSQIDIALDPFPYNGGSTSLDTLWMGVPLVSLAGRPAVQRGGAAILSTVGLSDMVAETPERYMEAAIFMAGIVGKIPDLRQNVRKAMANSPLRDEPGLVRAVEVAFRDMWRTWCREQTSSSAAAD